MRGSVPLARGGGVGDVVLERPGWPAESSLYPVGERGVLAVADGREDAGEQSCDGGWDAAGDLLFDVGLRVDIEVADRATGGLGDKAGSLTAWRMTIAADLLHDTDHTLATIAREVGYHDAFAFSVAFKRAHGTSPSAWRRQAR